jgi:hypothetical protein
MNITKTENGYTIHLSAKAMRMLNGPPAKPSPKPVIGWLCRHCWRTGPESTMKAAKASHRQRAERETSQGQPMPCRGDIQMAEAGNAPGRRKGKREPGPQLPDCGGIDIKF